MKAIRIIGLLLFLSFIFDACEKVEPPYKTGIDCEAGNRKVLIEDYTGHGCVNCPGAAVVARELQELCEERIIIMAVHAGYFAGTESFGPEFTYDFTTEAGNGWNTFYGIIGNPKGMVNRIDGGVGVVTVPDKWGEKVVSELELPADVDINISTSYNETEKKIYTTVEGQFLSSINGKFNLVVCVTESEIIKPQKNNDAEIGEIPNILEYEHQHVLRASMNGPWGNEIAAGDVVAGQDYSKSYSIDLGDDWVSENCHIVAFIYQDSDKAIIQVEEGTVIE